MQLLKPIIGDNKNYVSLLVVSAKRSCLQKLRFCNAKRTVSEQLRFALSEQKLCKTFCIKRTQASIRQSVKNLTLQTIIYII